MDEKEETIITFKQVNDTQVEIYKYGKLVGQIFTPSGSGNENDGSIQVCGFSEAFCYWGCGVFKGFKDIQLYFGESMEGNPDFDHCHRCYMNPCQCELRVQSPDRNPFIVKRNWSVKKIQTKEQEEVEEEI